MNNRGTVAGFPWGLKRQQRRKVGFQGPPRPDCHAYHQRRNPEPGFSIRRLIPTMRFGNGRIRTSDSPTQPDLKIDGEFIPRNRKFWRFYKAV